MPHIKLKSLLREIDWVSPDVQDMAKKTRCMPIEAVKNWLNSEVDRIQAGKKYPNNMPRLTRNTIEGLVISDENGQRKVNIEQFIDILTTPPKTIFDVGEKAIHTQDSKTMMINTGIPALRGIVWDKEANNFKIINTCPSAGTCPVDCYALFDKYIWNDGKNLKLAQRLQTIMENPKAYIEQGFREARRYAQEAKWDDKILEIRWNDAGDFFSDRYFNSAMEITRRLLDADFPVKSYFYTKVGKYVELGQQMGMEVTFSQGGIDTVKNARKKSVIVPREVFKRFLTVSAGKAFKKDEKGKTLITPEAKEQLRKAIFDEYKDDANFEGLDMENLKFTDELPAQEAEERKYSCIILPGGDSDRPAQRADVKNVFLLKH